jgi:hypothetical protein
MFAGMVWGRHWGSGLIARYVARGDRGPAALSILQLAASSVWSADIGSPSASHHATPDAWAGRRAPRLVLFFLLNSMVSGDIMSDRETWGLLMLVLLVEVQAPVRLPGPCRTDRPGRPAFHLLAGVR